MYKATPNLKALKGMVQSALKDPELDKSDEETGNDYSNDDDENNKTKNDYEMFNNKTGVKRSKIRRKTIVGKNGTDYFFGGLVKKMVIGKKLLHHHYHHKKMYYTATTNVPIKVNHETRLHGGILL